MAKTNKCEKYTVHVHNINSGKSLSCDMPASWFEVSTAMSRIKTPARGSKIRLVCGKDVFVDARPQARKKITGMSSEISKEMFQIDIQVVVEVSTSQLMSLLDHRFDTRPAELEAEIEQISKQIQELFSKRTKLTDYYRKVMNAKTAWKSEKKNVEVCMPNLPIKPNNYRPVGWL